MKFKKNTWAYIQMQLAATDTTNGFSSREEKFSESPSNLARKMIVTYASIKSLAF